MSTEKQTGVYLTSEEVSRSTEKKKSKPMTIAQLPAYRTARALLSIVMRLTGGMPRNKSCFIDQVIRDTTELMKSIALAQENRGEERCYYISNAIALTAVVRSYLIELHDMQLIGKDICNKAKKLCESESSQLAGWRDFTVRQGYDESILNNGGGVTS